MFGKMFDKFVDWLLSFRPIERLIVIIGYIFTYVIRKKTHIDIKLRFPDLSLEMKRVLVPAFEYKDELIFFRVPTKELILVKDRHISSFDKQIDKYLISVGAYIADVYFKEKGIKDVSPEKFAKHANLKMSSEWVLMLDRNNNIRYIDLLGNFSWDKV